MSRASVMIDRMNDFLNPVAVKELRQAVQGKFIMGILLLFLTVAVGAIGLAAMAYEEGSIDFDAGRGAFLFFMAILMGTCMLFIPVYSGIRMSSERSGDNIDLLFATTLRPGAIVWGKFVSAMILCILIYSVCMPFMTLTYLLRGIDLPSIFFLLVVGLLAVMACVQTSIFLASLPVSRAFKVLLGLAALGGMISLFSVVMAISAQFLQYGVGSSIGSWKDFWWPLLSIIVLLFMGMGFLHVLTATIISPPSANRALLVRIYITSAWLGGGIMAGVWSKYYTEHTPVTIWVILFGCLLCLMLMAGVSEREQLGPRVARAIPKRVIFRISVFLFFSGAGGGVIWAVLMMALTLGLGLYWMRAYPGYFQSNDLNDCLEFMTCLCLYFSGYSLAALHLRRLLKGRFIKPVMTWTIVCILMVIASVVPPIVAFMVRAKIGYMTGVDWFIGNPFALIGYPKHFELFLVVSGLFAGIMLVLSVPWLHRQINGFKPQSKV